MSRARPNGRAFAIYTQICKTIPLAHEQETVWNADLCFWSWEIFAAAPDGYMFRAQPPRKKEGEFVPGFARIMRSLHWVSANSN